MNEVIETTKISYYEERITKLNVVNSIDTDWDGQPVNMNFFKEHEKGIEICYYLPNGSINLYEKGQNRKLVHYTRLRYNKENEAKIGRKYHSESGTRTQYFYPFEIIQAYRNKTEINNLIVTEGEFKAAKACKEGLLAVGIQGIHNYKDSSTTELPQDFVNLVVECNVKNIILLFDADCKSRLNIESQLSEGKDLGVRLSSFYSAARGFRELWKSTCMKTDLYFSRISEKFELNGKGIDDLLLEEYPEKIIKDFIKLEKSKIFFETFNISDNSLWRPQKYFLQTRDKKGMPADFYEEYADLLGEKEFIFNGTTYQIKDNTLMAVYHPATDNFIRVGTSYFYRGYNIHMDKTGKTFKTSMLQEWDKSTIKDDYGHIHGFIQSIKKYPNFCNIPSNKTNEYEHVIEGCWNLYEKPIYTPKEGSWIYTEKMLKHIFGDQYDMGIDWLRLLHNKPAQKLPAIALVSHEQNTGKSTPLFWLNEIYGNNTAMLGNEDFNENFNSHWVSKLLVCIDEGFIEKKLIKERLKSMITNTVINLRAMRENKIKIDCHLHFMLTSNNEDNFIALDDQDTRFWVIKVPVLTESDPDMLSKLKEEIPAFLYYIEDTAIQYKCKDRLWFAPKDFRTEAMDKVIMATKSKTEKTMIAWAEDVFNILKDNNMNYDYIHIIPSYLAKELQKYGLKQYVIIDEIVKVLRYSWHLETPDRKTVRVKFPIIETTGVLDPDWIPDEDENPANTKMNIAFHSIPGQPYILEYERFLKISGY